VEEKLHSAVLEEKKDKIIIAGEAGRRKEGRIQLNVLRERSINTTFRKTAKLLTLGIGGPSLRMNRGIKIVIPKKW